MNQKKEFFIITAMILGIFMASLDNTIVSASINHVLADIGGFERMSWVFTAYVLASTSTMLIFGKLSDLYGRKRFFLIGVGLFLVGSALCGTAQSIEQLILYRAIQGVGSGALLPISFTIIFSIFNDPKKAAKMTGIFAAVFGLSSVLGPQLGTWISEGVNWRWCFYVNIPLGLFSFFTLLFTLKESISSKKPKLDVAGTILLMISTISLMLVFEWGGNTYGWTSWPILALGATSLVGITSFIFVERSVSEPILPLGVFKNKVISITSFVVFCQGVLMFSAITYIPIFAVGVLGKTGSNGLLTPMMVSLMVGAALGGLLMAKFAFRTFYIVVMSSGVSVSYTLHLIGPDTPYGSVIVVMVFLGMLAIGPLMSVSQNAVANSIDKQYLGTANSLVSFWRNIGGIFGASIMATIVNRHLEQNLGEGIQPEALLGGQVNAPPEMMETIRHTLGEGINQGFLFATIVCALGLIVACFLGNQRFRYQSKGENAHD